MKLKLLAIIDNEFMSKTDKLDALRVHIKRCKIEVETVVILTQEDLNEFNKLNNKESK